MFNDYFTFLRISAFFFNMNHPQPTMSDGGSVMPLYGMNLQDLLILQNRACPLCPYPIGLVKLHFSKNSIALF
jgi:hypothetical protein